MIYLHQFMFRGKSIETGEWVHGHLRTCEILGLEAPPTVNKVEVRYETLGANIGLVDENNQEIYQDDIVLVHDTSLGINFKGIVKWACGSFYIHGPYTRVKHFRWMDYKVTVIGNIYDNQEMLDSEGFVI